MKNLTKKSIGFAIILAIFFSQSLLADISNKGLLPDEQNTIQIFDAVEPYVVYVHRIRRVVDSSLTAYNIRSGTGSGFVWDKQGHIVTNYHVVRGAKRFAVTLGKGETIAARLIAAEPRKDIAILKLESTSNLAFFKNFTPLKIANSSELDVGQKTLAIGNPYGLDRTLTTGIVSALGRRVPGVGGVTIRDMIQTDASINPGNSGGPLLDSQGRLIGMNTSIISRSGASAGIGFAVPSNTIKRIVEQLLTHGKVKLAGIGVHLLADRVARQLGVRGMIVAEVISGSPAEKAGLRGTFRNQYGELVIGDVITAIDGQKIKNYDDLYNVLSKLRIGQSIQLTVYRNNKSRTLTLTTIDVAR